MTTLRSILSSGLGSVAIKVLNTILAFALVVTMARLLGAHDYGIYAFAYAVLFGLAIPAQVGLPNLVVRETAKANATQHWETIRSLWRFSTVTALLFATAVTSLCLAVFWMTTIVPSQEHKSALLIALLALPLVALGNLRSAALRGLGHTLSGQLPESFLRPAVMLGALLAAAEWAPHLLSPAGAMEMFATAAFVSFVFGAILLYRATPPLVFSSRSPSHNIDRQRIRHWLSATLPLALVGGLQAITLYTDILILTFFRPSEDVGVYRVAVAGSALVAFGLEAVNMILMPHFARLYHSKDMHQLQAVVRQGAVLIFVAAASAYLILLVFGENLLITAFGPEYAGGYLALVVLATGQLLNAAAGSVGALLNMTGHARDTVAGLLAGAILNATLNLVLIPLYGIEGAAYATAITFVFWNVLLHRKVRQRLGIESSAFLPTPLPKAAPATHSRRS